MKILTHTNAVNQFVRTRDNGSQSGNGKYMSKVQKKWDRHSIKAEIGRKGLTLSGIAIDAGLAPSACGHGIAGMSRAGAQAIADALDIPFRELFPDSYIRGRHAEEREKRQKNKRTKAQDTAAA
jgi:Ner family transcriptional regulator